MIKEGFSKPQLAITNSEVKPISEEPGRFKIAWQQRQSIEKSNIRSYNGWMLAVTINCSAIHIKTDTHIDFQPCTMNDGLLITIELK